MNKLIRKANIADVKTIVSIWERFLNEHDTIVAARNSQLKEMNLRNDDVPLMYEKFLLDNIQSESGIVFVAEDNGQIIGYSLGFIKNEIPIFKIKQYGYISDMYVSKKYRNKGISSKLKDEMIAWFKGKGVEYASIGFYADNREAHEIYNKWGFFDYKIEARIKI